MKRGGPLRRRTPLKVTTLKRGGRVNPVSDKRRTENRERSAVLAEMRAEEPWCHAGIEGICTGRPDDGHELRSRARGGSITDRANIMLVCRPCHTHITENPTWAAEHGFAR